MWASILGILSALLGIIYLFAKYYISQDTPENKAKRDAEEKLNDKDIAVDAMQRREFDKLRQSIRKAHLRILTKEELKKNDKK